MSDHDVEREPTKAGSTIETQNCWAEPVDNSAAFLPLVKESLGRKMVLHAFVAVLVLLMAVAESAAQQGVGYNLEIIEVDDAEELRDLLEDPIDFVNIVLAPGEYRLIDDSDDNEDEEDSADQAEAIMTISGENVNLSAEEAGTVTIVLESERMLRFSSCRDCSLRNLNFVINPVGNSADTTTFIVVQESEVALLSSEIVLAEVPDSLDESNSAIVHAISVGESGRATISGNQFRAFNGNVISLYNNARVKIRDNLIRGAGPEAQRARGQGMAILMSDNSTGQVKNNLITHCYKGIGIRDNADGIVKDNVIEDMSTWGIAFWQTGEQAPVALIQHNVIFRTGACGAMIGVTDFEDGIGLFNDNLVVMTGQDERLDAADLFCYQTAIALHAVPDGFEMSGNTRYANRRGADAGPDHDVEGEVFEASLSDFCEFFLRKDIIAQHSFFFTNLCGLESGVFQYRK